MGSLRIPYAEIKSLILGVSDNLTDQMLEQLLKYLPKREEMDSLAPYKNKISELSDAEQFAVVVSTCATCIQWNLGTKDVLGAAVLSFVERLSSL